MCLSDRLGSILRIVFRNGNNHPDVVRLGFRSVLEFTVVVGLVLTEAVKLKTLVSAFVDEWLAGEGVLRDFL